MKRWFGFVVSLVIAQGAVAAERPQLPAPEVDTELMQGKAPREFFAARAGDAGCRDRLAAARAQSESLRREVEGLVASGAAAGAIEAAEKRADAARTELMDRVEECGECVTRPIQRVSIKTAARTEEWYVADGSCQVELQGEALTRGFEKARDLMRHVPAYPKHSGGFRSMLEFLPIDPATGQPTGAERLEFPAHAFVTLRGIELFGSLVAYAQVFRMEWKDLEEGAVAITYDGVRYPRGFVQPQVFDRLASGRRIQAQLMKLPKVIALWYFRPDGYVRYYTAGDFGVSLNYAERVGRRILQETLLQFSERYR